MELQEGTYDIPANCTVVYVKRQVIVKPMKEHTALHCRDCKHMKLGRKSMSHQWWDSFYCELSPKVINGVAGYYYSANPGKIACDKIEQKED